MRKLTAIALLTSASIVVSTALSGCMIAPPVPEQLVLTPPSLQASAPNMAAVNVQVRDQRIHNHILRVEHTDDNAEFATSSVPLATLISDAVRAYLPHQAGANRQFTVFLDEALIRVYPEGKVYRAEQRLALRVLVRSGGEWITREYVTTVSAGPYKVPDYEHLTRTFNQVIENTLQDVANDSILREWLANHAR